MKTPTEEIQYLGSMLTATTIEDTERLNTIIKRLKEITGMEDELETIIKDFNNNMIDLSDTI